MTSLLDRLDPGGADADDVLLAFMDHAADANIELYPAQEEAILEILAGNNVLLTTPTGSGKSLVAEAAHFAAMADGRRSFYTAPIKALVSEKFFALCRAFGTDNVGMVTGDASVNGDAPIICCTQEILANRALRDGAHTDADLVVIDEFHYYGDPQRGWAWQIPLLELSHTQFLLMSATLGPTGKFEHQLKTLTGRPTVEVTSEVRPVPLEFTYRETPLHESIDTLLSEGKAPVYLVYFTQKDAMAAAQSLTSINIVTKAEKEEIRAAIGDFRFDSPVGKDLKKFITSGIGIHHAGLLPKYRLLVEKLAQQGLLRVVAGTDTLGVGVNIPIRSVLFTQLCKFDGQEMRVLHVREFKQIAGRAGRKGFDDEGFVWAQAPQHVVENKRADEKAAKSGRKKPVRKKPPEWGYAPWNEDVFDRLVRSDPEPMVSSFQVSHQMLLNVLARPGDGGTAMRRLLLDNHEPRKRQRNHIRQAISMYRALVEAGVVEELEVPDDQGRRVRVTIDLQDEFALTQPLSLFALEVLEELDSEDPDYALDVVSVVESVLENPRPVMASQLKRVKDQMVFEMKAAGIEYDERMERLSEAEYPKPLSELLWGCFRVFRAHHPWVGDNTPKPKSVVREMFEMGVGFRDYVLYHGLKRSEGVLLRYLTDAYKGLRQNVPEQAKTDEVLDIQEWLGELIRQVDSSLIAEWERLIEGDETPAGELHEPDPTTPDRPDITRNQRAFGVMIRNEMFRWVQLVARRAYVDLAGLPGADGHRWRTQQIETMLAPYWDEHDHVGIDTDARHTSMLMIDKGAESWEVTQILADPEGFADWRLVGRVDLAQSSEAGEPVIALVDIVQLGERVRPDHDTIDEPDDGDDGDDGDDVATPPGLD